MKEILITKFSINLYSFNVISDGKESIKDAQLKKGPTGNVYIRDHEKQQHSICKG
jgi:hypothetical protein